MGNTSANGNHDTIVIPKWEKGLMKGYNCHYYIISSDPELFQKRKCLVVDHDERKLHYTLKDIELDLLYEDVPGVFVSSSRVDYSWDDYFKIGTVVKTNATSVERTNKDMKFKHRARIADVKHDMENGVTLDLVDARTNFRAYHVTPSDFTLDKQYYRIK
jgi:hypothetical protein